MAEGLKRVPGAEASAWRPLSCRLVWLRCVCVFLLLGNSICEMITKLVCSDLAALALRG